MGLTLGTLAAVTFAAGAVKSFGELQESRAAATAEEFNASIARQEAGIAREAGKLEARRGRRAAKKFTSTQRALVAKSGVRLEGSPLLVIEETAANLELDVLINQFNANVAESRALSESASREFTAGQTRRAGTIRAGTTLLTSGARLATSLLPTG